MLPVRLPRPAVPGLVPGHQRAARAPRPSRWRAAPPRTGTQYTYNDEDDLTVRYLHPASGAATTTTYSYPAPGSTQPHAVSSARSPARPEPPTTSYGYDADGRRDRRSPARPTQTLTWNDAGQLASVATTGASAADHQLHLRRRRQPAAQPTPAASPSTCPTSRSSSTPPPARSPAPATTPSAASPSRPARRRRRPVPDRRPAGHRHSIAIDSATLAVTRRHYDPYGNPIGAAPSSWPGNKGFVGGTTDSATGLTNLGAREYNPATGSFISPDSLLTPYDPQDLNAYAYADRQPRHRPGPVRALHRRPAPAAAAPPAPST